MPFLLLIARPAPTALLTAVDCHEVLHVKQSPRRFTHWMDASMGCSHVCGRIIGVADGVRTIRCGRLQFVQQQTVQRMRMRCNPATTITMQQQQCVGQQRPSELSVRLEDVQLGDQLRRHADRVVQQRLLARAPHVHIGT